MFLRHWAALTVFLAVVCVAAGGTWWFAFTSALDQMEERGRADLALAADRLTGQLQRFRELAVLSADHPLLAALVLGEGASPVEVAAMLRGLADKTGTLEIEVVDADNRILASAGGSQGAPAASPAYRRAMTGALGAAHFLDDQERRVFAFASPIFDPAGPVAGAVIVSIDLANLEQNWPVDPSPVFFSDSSGAVFISSRSELVLTARSGLGANTDFLPAGIRPFPKFGAIDIGPHELWSLDSGASLPSRALHLTLPLPIIGMAGEILLDIKPALDLAALQAAVVGALCLAFGAFIFFVRERLAIEAQANAALEARVAARTEELSAANESLLREIGERKEAEAALKRAQAELVQAGKLSALGQMSAGISHELNQPLMAIRSFAENAETFMERGKPEVARQNLARISELARRMGRIIKNLRAFARQESEAVSDVDLVAVVEAVMELADGKIQQAGVGAIWQPPATPVMVRGGEVRLQQVVMNLVSNAVDAMEDSGERHLQIEIVRDGDRVRLAVRDTGPGIAEPEKIFDPFYSTKEVGKSEGMGLGLSISYGLVQSFGGEIRGRNRDGGGAEFTVELKAAKIEQAA
ncbi:MAG: sensor histidine kinase [Rhodobacteraceae bacterium]|nr:sensor histidine kinase [Paracoccaceae bacterium]